MLYIKKRAAKLNLQLFNFFCGEYWIRTSDPLGVNQVL